MNWMKAGVDYGVLGLLLAMSICAFGLFLERRRFFLAVRVAAYPDRKELELALTARLNLIAIIASNAPYIGLLGTVLGIMLTFAQMGQGGGLDGTRIMTGLSLALKSTAAGLVVAIPSVTWYNLLLRRVKVLLTRWDIDHG